MALETRLSLAPGQNGTKKLLAQYGDKLVRVRYRYDTERWLRLKTVELIVETTQWKPRARAHRRVPTDHVGVQIAYGEADLRARIKAAGGIWRPRHRLWEVDWKIVRDLQIEDRVVDPEWGGAEE